jgi:YHS domain-containing protein
MEKAAQWSLVAAAWVLVAAVTGLGIYAIRHFSPRPQEERLFGTAEHPLCPVDHVEVQALSGTPKVAYQGKIYYFCGNKDPLGREHKTLFLMDPQLYLSGVSAIPSPAPSPSPLPSPSSTAPAAAASPQAASPTAVPTYNPIVKMPTLYPTVGMPTPLPTLAPAGTAAAGQKG